MFPPHEPPTRPAGHTFRQSFARLIPALLPVLLASCAASKSILSGPIKDAPPIHSAAFRQTMGHIVGTPFSGGNRVTTLVNGDQIFPAMLGAIRSARRTITFETFVFEKGDVPKAFADALAERARAGVKVKVILDAHGAKDSRTYNDELRDAGVEVERYHPIFWPDVRRYNFRTHRKLLVIDGKVGFIGGVGIADEWAGNADSPEHWRDCHYRIEGPAVAQLQGAFSENWLRTRKEILTGPDYFPPLAPAGSVQTSVFRSSPHNGSYEVPLMYHLAIASARHSLKIENAYFVPDQQMSAAFVDAAQRGVHVQIIVPGEHIDQKAVRRASKKRWKKLLEAGIEIYEFQPTMIHSKLLIADGLFVSLGSANFDNRSLRLNDEANMDVLDAGFAAQQTRIFEKDLARSVRVDAKGHAKGALLEKPVQVAQTPLEPQL
jgi:cardiolipin synthase